MNIGITCYPTFGGSGTVATNLGHHLAKRGHNIHFVSSALPYKLKYTYNERIRFHEVEQVNYPLFIDNSPYVLLLASKMAEVAADAKLDIMHVHYAIPHAVAALLCGQMMGKKRPKIVTTLHGTDVTLIGSLASLKGMTKFSIDNSDGVTVVSEYLLRKTIEVFDPEREIKVITNFFDPADFNRDKKEANLRPGVKGEKKIIHISNFRKVKRIPDVIEIFRIISSNIPARLYLVGEGPETCVAREIIRKHSLTDKVEFLGPLYDIAPVLSNADLLLQVSDHESFGLTSLEALACGVPVIGTSGSGISEVVDDGQNGFLSTPGDTVKMGADALKLLSDTALWSSFSANGAESTIKRFAADKIIGKYESFYNDILGR
ncbi:MAG: N-acetyl-alpha-D-glucosaminyl L-malate synthase BshA [Fibrobacteres bacterium]|nr:N-acetyl-alpha-D-glucosaminyl L-malate synthase BshA [Fibrobacterota bacterium]